MAEEPRTIRRSEWGALFVQSIIERITTPQGQVYVGPNYSTVDLLKDLLKLRDHFLDGSAR